MSSECFAPAIQTMRNVLPETFKEECLLAIWPNSLSKSRPRNEVRNGGGINMTNAYRTRMNRATIERLLFSLAVSAVAGCAGQAGTHRQSSLHSADRNAIAIPAMVAINPKSSESSDKSERPTPATKSATKPESPFQFAAHRSGIETALQAPLTDQDNASTKAVDTIAPEDQIPVPIPRLNDEPIELSGESSPSDLDAVPSEEEINEEPTQQIDLGAALGMAGGSAWTIQLARQRTVEAHSELDRAKAVWFPNLQFGIGYNKHEGTIQATPGTIIDASRNSFFVGGGATTGQAPIAGGASGPLRLTADLALADAFFGPKIARRNFDASRYGITVAKNRAMLQAGVAYINLIEAAAQIADAQAAIEAAAELAKLTTSFERAGAGAQADVDRAETELARTKQSLENAERNYRVRSAQLARRIRLDPSWLLLPADQYLVPIDLVARDGNSAEQISIAHSKRPEICELSQRISALCVECKKERVAPWIPNVAVTTSSGMFQGGPGSRVQLEGGRADYDVQALWELENMGLGVKAKRKNVASRLAQRRIQLADLRDQISMEVMQANENVANYWLQIQTAKTALELAESSYERNLNRVRNNEGLPIELLQAIVARAEGLRSRTAAVADYNRAQLELLFATGQI